MSSTSGAGSYRAVLTLPYAAATFGAALVGRLSYGLLPLALLFTVQHATRSFTTAGTVLASIGVTSLLLPMKARIVDRHGPSRVLPVLAGAAAGALALIAVLAWAGVSTPAAYVALGVVAGATAPPLGPAMRSVWRTITAGTDQTGRAYSVDSVCEETLYLVGPLVVGLVLRIGSAPGALLLTAALMLTGTAVMSRMPPVRTTRVVAAGPSSRWGVGPLRSAGFRPVVLTILVTAAGIGIATTCVAARAQAAGRPAAAGYIEAALAVGSVLGGLAWGRRRHTRRTSTHLVGLTLTLAAGVAVAGTTGHLLVLGIVLAAAGVAVAPLFVVSYLAADRLAPAHQRTEASTWVNTANNIGAAIGASLAGVLVDHVAVGATFGAGAVLLAGAATLVLVVRRRIDTGHQPASEPAAATVS
ncbi:MFS transporter [Actinocatenispora rupis]|uniref:MFS transporter n=1 Tax=Actinocatenispora rupis TaxID=519421 RepID=A0A8J3NAK8_9ACTN|nr:MFS transporter [Actinocatenispora rupis]GID12484.1 MFS transporter [Actinocatenispora rupis]